MITALFLVGCGVLGLGYVVYGRLLSHWFGVDATRRTPAQDIDDGIDFVPSHTPVVFGHHFSSIAGAGPIVGPIMAALWFGWLPAVLWVLIGPIFIGGVHDYGSLIASLRHRGGSIGEICRQHLSPFTHRAFLIFVWFTLVYVLVVFLDLTAATFSPPNLADATAVRMGGAVATASILYCLLALAFGTANQLMAALSLLVLLVWLAGQRRRRLFVLLPMLFMMVSTLIMLWPLTIRNLFRTGGQLLVGAICLTLFVLSLLVVIDTARHWRRIAGGDAPRPA